MARRTRTVPALLLATLLLACGGGGGGGGGSGNPGAKAQGWTVLVYLVADNDLEPFALKDLDEMGAVGSGGGVRIVAQVDRSPDYTNAGVLGLPDFTDTKRIVVNQGQAQVVQEMGEQDMASPATLAAFIEWGVKTYPADHTMLVLWDHGASWIGFGVDETSGQGRLLRLNDVVAGVSQGVQRAGLAKLDVVGFDACLMATWEVAEGLKPYASYLLASEEVEPGHGWDYHALAAAKGNAAISAVDLGKAVVDGFKAQAAAQGTSNAITLSLVDLGALGGLEGAMQALAPLAPSATSLARGRAAALEFGKQPNAAQSYDMVDLGDLFAEAGAPAFAAVKSQIDAGLAQAVVYQVKGPATAAATGLAVWFPQTGGSYDRAKATYAQFGGIQPWRTFLEGYLAGGASAAPPSFVAGSGGFDEAFGTPPSLLLAGNVTNLADVASVTIDVGFPGANDTADVYGEFPGVIGANAQVGKDVAATWDWQVLKLTQGATTSRGYIEVVESGQGVFTATVPFGYFLAGQTQGDYAFRVLVFDTGGRILQDDMYLVNESGAVGAFSPSPGSTLCPTVLHVTGATSSSWSGEWVCNPNGVELDATQDFSLAFEDVGAGTPYYAALWITNAAQEGAFISVSGRTRP